MPAVWARCTAPDTKLKRDVALKVLPEAFARDPEGGPAKPVARVDEKRGEVTVNFPYLLPDGKRFLTRVQYGDHSSIELAHLGSFERKTVLQDAYSAPILAATPSASGPGI